MKGNINTPIRYKSCRRFWSLMLWVILMGALSVVEAQEIRISSPFAVSKTRNEAVTRPRVDFNHDTCALVIVNLDFEEVDFEGDIKLMQYRDGEWWIYLSPGANWLTILSEYHTPLRVDFAPVRPATTYTLGLRAAVTMQTIEVVDPCQADITMVDARRFSRMDASGRTCALVRIGFVQPNVEFSGAVDKEYRRGEWWVWFPVDATTTTIDAPGYEPLTITFEPLQTAVTYVMTLKKGKEETKIVGGQKPKAEAKTKRKTEPKPEPKSEPKQEPTPEPEPIPEPTPEPTPELVPEPTPESVVVQEVPPAVAPAVTEPVQEKPVAQPKQKKTSSDSNKGWSWPAALESTVVPGLGQALKGRWGSGVATFLGEAALAGGIYYTYTLAEEQRAIIENNNTSLADFQKATTAYKQYQMINIGLIGAVAAVHVYNIIRAGTINPRTKGDIVLAPAVMPADAGLAPSLSLTYTF